VSGVTGEIGFKIGAAANQLVRVDQIMTATAGGTALQAQGPVFVTGVMTISTGLEILNTAGTTTQFMLTLLAGTNVGKASGLQVRAGNAAVDVPIQVIDVAGTGTLLMVGGDGHGNLGWNYTSNLPILKAIAVGEVDALGALTVTSLNSLTAYSAFSQGGASLSSGPGGIPLTVFASGTNVSGGGNKVLVVAANNIVVLGTTTAYTWGTGTLYPTMQISGVGAIFGSATEAVSLVGGGAYWNGTNYINGQAGTAVIASLGTGSFTISISGTQATAAGTAHPTVVFSIGGTVTSNKIQGYGPTAAALVDMTPDTGTFTGTWGGFVTAPVNTAAYWSRQGNQVMLLIPYGTASKSGAAGAITFAPLPAAIQPVKTMFVGIPNVLTGTAVPGGGQVTVQASSTLSFFQGAGGSPFNGTAAASIGLSGGFTVIQYPIGP
jgi:hypothetical protein